VIDSVTLGLVIWFKNQVEGERTKQNGTIKLVVLSDEHWIEKKTILNPETKMMGWKRA